MSDENLSPAQKLAKQVASLQQDIIDIKRALGFPDDFPHEDLIFELERMKNE